MCHLKHAKQCLPWNTPLNLFEQAGIIHGKIHRELHLVTKLTEPLCHPPPRAAPAPGTLLPLALSWSATVTLHQVTCCTVPGWHLPSAQPTETSQSHVSAEPAASSPCAAGSRLPACVPGTSCRGCPAAPQAGRSAARCAGGTSPGRSTTRKEKKKRGGKEEKWENEENKKKKEK